jgi:hypothetical protein
MRSPRSRLSFGVMLAFGAMSALGVAWLPAPLSAQTSDGPPPQAQGQDFLLTVFLRHDQSKTLGEINQHLRQTGFFRRFPPPGVEVASWYVMMGIGQVVTLKVPPDRLREVNRILEETAWGGFTTEFYPPTTIARGRRRSVGRRSSPRPTPAIRSRRPCANRIPLRCWRKL